VSNSTMTFEYKVRDRAGAVQTGQMEAASLAAVAKTLRDKGFVPLKIAERQVGSLDREFKLPGFGKKVKNKEVAVFSRQLATMVNSGLTLVRALTVLQEQAQNPAFAGVISDVRARVEQGSSLSVSLANHPKIFGTLYVSMVQAGEVGGALDETLMRLADTLEASVRLRSKVKAAMAYPVMVFGLVILITLAMLIFIVPIFTRLYADLGGTLPVPTQILVKLSKLLTTWWWLIGLVTVGSVVGFRRWIKTPEGREKWDRFKLRMPLFGKLVQKVAISRFSRTMSVLSRTGVPVLQALEIVAATAGNAVVATALRDVQDSVKRGESLAGPLTRHEVFPPMVTHMMAVGEETGALDAMLGKVADFYDQEVDSTVSGITSLIEPILIVIMAVVTGGILISLYLPMFNVASLIK
jgi:type IV pilus assembly protein PilC